MCLQCSISSSHALVLKGLGRYALLRLWTVLDMQADWMMNGRMHTSVHSNQPRWVNPCSRSFAIKITSQHGVATNHWSPALINDHHHCHQHVSMTIIINHCSINHLTCSRSLSIIVLHQHWATKQSTINTIAYHPFDRPSTMIHHN